MGLDIYLEKYKNLEKKLQLEAEYQKVAEKHWHFEGRPYKELTDKEKAWAREEDKKTAKSLGLDEDGEYREEGDNHIEFDVEAIPNDHLFRLDYFRSSYNSGGINSVLRNLIGKDLYDIFDKHNNEDYYFKPDWNQSLQNVDSCIRDLKQKILDGNNYKTMKLYLNSFRPADEFPKDGQEALQIFLQEKEKHLEGIKNNPDREAYNYSNINGEFFFSSPPLFEGFIPVMEKFGSRYEPAFYAIYKDDGMNWYVQALEIVKQTIEFVLRQKDSENYCLGWSA